MRRFIQTNENDIAENLMISADPSRVKFIAENFLEDVICYSEIRGMNGYTGLYNGKKVSIQAVGLGMPSALLYLNELLSYNVKKIINIGLCDAIQNDLKLEDLIVVMGAASDSNLGEKEFLGLDYPVNGTFNLLNKAYKLAKEKSLSLKFGNVITSDYYSFLEREKYGLWSKYSLLAVDTTTYALYLTAAKRGIESLSVLTVSSNLLTGEKVETEGIERKFTEMLKIALYL